ncbi:hypothetical protein PMI34_04207, partial [Pseudomonas sp. GM74]
GGCASCRTCGCTSGTRITTGGRIFRSCGWCNAGSNAPIKILVSLQVFLLHARYIILQNFNRTLLALDLLLH